MAGNATHLQLQHGAMLQCSIISASRALHFVPNYNPRNYLSKSYSYHHPSDAQ